MADLHIQDFFADAARTIVSLYRIFPRPVTLFVEDICGPDEPDEYGVHSHRHQACFAAMLFLANEGFIEFKETIRSEALDQVALTGRCLSLLLAPVTTDYDTSAQDNVASNATELPPSVQAEHATLVFQLEQSVQHHDNEKLIHLMQGLLGQMTQGR